jgi:hypothetical protein
MLHPGSLSRGCTSIHGQQLLFQLWRLLNAEYIVIPVTLTSANSANVITANRSVAPGEIAAVGAAEATAIQIH